MFVVIT
jgi:p-aminobenzoyl-glutamate transporter AbgT